MRALTDSEFAAHSAQDANDDDSASAAAAARVIDAFFDTSAQDSDKDAATPALNPQPPILGPPSPPVQASGAPAQAPSAAPGGQPTATAASEQTRRSLHQAASAPSQRVGKRRSESAESAPDAAENRQAGPAARRHAGLRPETQRSKQAAGQSASSGRREQRSALAVTLLSACLAKQVGVPPASAGLEAGQKLVVQATPRRSRLAAVFPRLQLRRRRSIRL